MLYYFASGAYRLLMAGWLLLMLPRLIHQDTAAAALDRNFDKRERTLIHFLQGQTRVSGYCSQGVGVFWQERENTDPPKFSSLRTCKSLFQLQIFFWWSTSGSQFTLSFYSLIFYGSLSISNSRNFFFFW